jgi:anti-anti-sigma factor
MVVSTMTAVPSDDTAAEVAEAAGNPLRMSVTRREHDTLVLTVAGEVDLVTDGQLRDQGLRLLIACPALMVISLKDVTFLDSRGLAALVAIRRRAVCLGVRLRFVLPAGHRVHNVLNATALDKLLEIYPTIAEALGTGMPDDRPD